MPADRSPLGKKRELPILDLSLSSTGCLVRWNVGTGWQEGAGDLGQTLNDSVLHPSWIVATRGAGLRSIKGGEGGGGGLEGTKGGEGWRASRAAWSRWAIYRPHSSSPSSSASSTMSTCSSVGKRILPSLFMEGERRWFSCSRLDRVIATAYAHPPPGLSTISQFRRYYQIRTALRVSPKLPVKVEVNQLRNREYTPFEFSVSIGRGGWG